MSGNFSVQLSENNLFGRNDANKTIENTINKEMKTPGAVRGFSINRAAVDRWNLNARRRAVFRAVLHKHIEYKPSRYVHYDLLPGRIKRDERDVSHIIESTECSFINPFGDESELMVIASGVNATEEIKDHLNAESYGKSAMDEFVKKRLSEKPIQDFFDQIKKRFLKTFASLMLKSLVKVNKKEVMIKADRTLFGRMAIIGHSRDIDLKFVFSYPLGPFPWSLADRFGMMRKTNKTAICESL